MGYRITAEAAFLRTLPQGQMATYKEAAAGAAAELARVEGEVLATARLATGLEARLRAALAARDAAEARAAAAAQAASEVCVVL